MAAYFVERWRLSVRQACRLVDISRTVFHYRAMPSDDAEVRSALRELGQQHPKYGCPMLTGLLRARGFSVNHKRVERIYREENMALRRKRRGKKVVVERSPLNVPDGPCQTWGLDFIHDRFIKGGSVVSFRCLTVLDIYSRFCLHLEPRTRYSSCNVVFVMDKLVERHGKPTQLRLDNGPEFRSVEFIEWAKAKGIELAFSQPGKPQQNGFVESFHSRFRYECLSSHRFTSLDQASHACRGVAGRIQQPPAAFQSRRKATGNKNAQEIAREPTRSARVRPSSQLSLAAIRLKRGLDGLGEDVEVER